MERVCHAEGRGRAAVLQAPGQRLTGVALGDESFADGPAGGAALHPAAALSAVQGLAGVALRWPWGARRAQAGVLQSRDPQLAGPGLSAC